MFQENVGSISHNQGHEIVLQIEKALKAFGKIPIDGVSKLIGESFFEKSLKQKILNEWVNFHPKQFFGQYRPKIVDLKYFNDFQKLPQKKDIFIDILKPNKKIMEYHLPEGLTPLALKAKIGGNNLINGPLDVNLFWLILFLLVINPELGKKWLGFSIEKGKFYFLQCQFSEKEIFEVTVEFDGKSYDLDAYPYVDSSDIKYAKRTVYISTTL